MNVGKNGHPIIIFERHTIGPKTSAYKHHKFFQKCRLSPDASNFLITPSLIREMIETCLK